MDKQHKILRIISHGDLTSLRELYSNRPHGFDLANCVYERTGDSAVHVAVQNGHLDVLQ